MKLSKLLFPFLICFLAPLSHAADLKVSVQLWSVRDDLKSDFRGTISKLAEMGFQGVELAGEYGEFSNDPEGLAQFIESKGMVISGTHTGFDLLTDEKIENTLDYYRRAGVTAAIISWDERAFSEDTVWQTIADLNQLQPIVESYGIKFGYHNHAQEFGTYKDTTLWEHIGRSTKESLVMQLDAGWAQFASKDPAKLVETHAGRTLSTHYKAAANEADLGKLPLIGQDSLDWPALIEANRTVGGTEWVVLEQEEYPNGLTPLEAVLASKQALDRYLAEREN